jgi:hypothetical protein
MNPAHNFTPCSSEFILVGKPEGKIARRKQENEYMDWIHLAQDITQR